MDGVPLESQMKALLLKVNQKPWFHSRSHQTKMDSQGDETTSVRLITINSEQKPAQE
jgi:hypothetical protein